MIIFSILWAVVVLGLPVALFAAALISTIDEENYDNNK